MKKDLDVAVDKMVERWRDRGYRPNLYQKRFFKLVPVKGLGDKFRVIYEEEVSKDGHCPK